MKKEYEREREREREREKNRKKIMPHVGVLRLDRVKLKWNFYRSKASNRFYSEIVSSF